MPGRRKRQLNRAAFVFVLFAVSARFAFCQLNSSAAGVVLIATLESLTVSATPTAITILLAPGGMAKSALPISITTAWAVRSNRTTIRVVGYFASATEALSTRGSLPSNIPAAAVLGQITTGAPTSFTKFTQTGAPGPVETGLTLVTQMVGDTNLAATRTDNLDLEIDQRSVPQQRAGAYTGTLNILVQAL